MDEFFLRGIIQTIDLDFLKDVNYNILNELDDN